ncbi:cupin domain-containing protein [Photobacterium sp. WH77]|uniref:cupin domain-containing protein n=1 Tax=unclassified Photobacterium TaxID=2628852 RepID=UPI001EDBCA20|nr:MULTISPECIES: cupin domain-containing protein [unclassified Photobacterium]MCG2838443.1 cupin domain-containing protein [Photobacterium sp. WH77]MCG2846060.1 cupin domain-containing protein [Photobacterium sp. WH80]
MTINKCQPGNLSIQDVFSDIPDNLPEELFQTLINTSDVRIERIISRGHQTPPDEWYDQNEDEWVMVIQGAAELAFDDGRLPVRLREGQSIYLPAHCRHRVSWTAPGANTIWLAVFLPPDCNDLSILPE